MRIFHVNGLLAVAAVLALVALGKGGTVHAQSDRDLSAIDREVVELAAAGRYSEASAMARRALEVAETRYGPDDPQVGDRLVALAEVERLQGRDAEPIMTRALAIYERTLPPLSPETHQGLKFPLGYDFLDNEKKLLARRELQKAQERRKP
jgi:hypothetical protein